MVPTIDQNGDIKQYIIKYQKYKDPSNMITKNEWEYLNLKSTQLYHTIAGLIPYTRYEIQIHASTIAGEGPGHWLTLKTDEDGEYPRVTRSFILRSISQLWLSCSFLGWP